jgi:peptidyl-prolyl cis-trans isomerase-like 3
MSLTINTNCGPLKIELFTEDAPESCFNFLAHAASGVYDGTIFHKSIPGFVLQGGDPTNTGKGGEAWCGGRLPSEPSAVRLKHDRRGIVSLARVESKERSVGSQFFITYDRQPSLDGIYPVIGTLIDGFDTLKTIEHMKVTGDKFRPSEDILIQSIHIHANPLA